MNHKIVQGFEKLSVVPALVAAPRPRCREHRNTIVQSSSVMAVSMVGPPKTDCPRVKRKSDLGIPLPYTWLNPSTRPSKRDYRWKLARYFRKSARGCVLNLNNQRSSIGHAGSKGTAREDIVRNFLCKHLPTKYDLGAGEIVGRIRGETSRQSDVIVFDKLNGVKLYSEGNVQVFPVDCFSGIIEVKSSLSKAELVDALEKIKTLKSLAPGGNVARPSGGGMTICHARPRPFGMVFAYGLAGNSLDSLSENLREWEKNELPTHWPNYICVLGAGNILHAGKPFEDYLDSDQITRECWPIALHYGQDGLFQFFCSLHDMCARMSLGPVQLRHYDEPSERIGSHIVGVRPLTLVKAGNPHARSAHHRQ